MKKYILFLDTETSDLPKKWDKKYSDIQNWPHVLQLAWIIFDMEINEIKRTNKYIYEPLIPISRESEKIHGLTPHFLREHGDNKKNVLRKLAHDLKKYNPLIVGHFLSFDLQVLCAEFVRVKLPIPFEQFRYFCTLWHSKKYVRNPNMVYMNLALLHEALFTTLPENMHHAEKDAEITAKCYFEMIRRNELSIADVENQQAQFLPIFQP
ncbi:MULTISPECIES: 3'-5' exonuclease [Sphingobacterium]|uniref:3'-5' exonuclease n=1 Tax=Sphingobacterium TaxID=28453 RepID=UPI00200DF33C|nr:MULTISPECIES: 3'-5' exonuclease [Sphingobacterium]UPZ38253.1 3'-5' exonuclease [Sphingobacterium sp. PCS056]WGQ13240.1 3'-5' exonuclease [Sphingobacterium faecium]